MSITILDNKDKLELENAINSKLNAMQGEEHAHKLLYVADDGNVQWLGLGPGLAIVAGVLTITYAGNTTAALGGGRLGTMILG